MYGRSFNNVPRSVSLFGVFVLFFFHFVFVAADVVFIVEKKKKIENLYYKQVFFPSLGFENRSVMKIVGKKTVTALENASRRIYSHSLYACEPL